MRDLSDPLERKIAHPLLGRQVRVVIGRKGMETRTGLCTFDAPEPHELLEHDVTVDGVLLVLRAGGDVAVLRDDGAIEYAWPALDIRPRRPCRPRWPCRPQVYGVDGGWIFECRVHQRDGRSLTWAKAIASVKSHQWSVFPDEPSGPSAARVTV